MSDDARKFTTSAAIVFVLVTVMLWGDVQAAVGLDSGINAVLYDRLGIAGFTKPLFVVLALGEAASLWFVYKPQRVGLWIILATVALGTVETIATTIPVIKDPRLLELLVDATSGGRSEESVRTFKEFLARPAVAWVLGVLGLLQRLAPLPFLYAGRERFRAETPIDQDQEL